MWLTCAVAALTATAAHAQVTLQVDQSGSALRIDYSGMGPVPHQGLAGISLVRRNEAPLVLGTYRYVDGSGRGSITFDRPAPIDQYEVRAWIQDYAGDNKTRRIVATSPLGAPATVSGRAADTTPSAKAAPPANRTAPNALLGRWIIDMPSTSSISTSRHRVDASTVAKETHIVAAKGVRNMGAVEIHPNGTYSFNYMDHKSAGRWDVAGADTPFPGAIRLPAAYRAHIYPDASVYVRRKDDGTIEAIIPPHSAYDRQRLRR